MVLIAVSPEALAMGHDLCSLLAENQARIADQRGQRTAAQQENGHRQPRSPVAVMHQVSRSRSVLAVAALEFLLSCLALVPLFGTEIAGVPGVLWSCQMLLDRGNELGTAGDDRWIL